MSRNKEHRGAACGGAPLGLCSCFCSFISYYDYLLTFLIYFLYIPYLCVLNIFLIFSFVYFVISSVNRFKSIFLIGGEGVVSSLRREMIHSHGSREAPGNLGVTKYKKFAACEPVTPCVTMTK